MKVPLRLLQYIRPYLGRFLLAIFFSVLVACFTAGYAWLMKPAIDELFISKDQSWLVLIPVGIIVVTLCKGLASYAQSYLMTYVGVRAITDIRHELFTHLLQLPMKFHLVTSSSHMLSRVINDVNWIQNSVASTLKDLFQSSLIFLFLLGSIFYLNWQLTLFSLAVLPLTVYPIAKFGKRMRKFSTRGQERTADMALVLQENLTGIRVVKGFGREVHEGQRFDQMNEAFFRTTMKSTQVSALTNPVLEAIGVLGIAGIVWYGGSQVIEGQEGWTPGGFMSFLTAVVLMYTPIKRMAGANNNIQQALAAAARVFQVLDQPTEAVRDIGTKDIDAVHEAIRLNRVGFQYEEAGTAALQDVTVTVRSGEILALVGSSGAGKTTFINLIPRFYDPTSGSISIDGVDLREIRLASLRQLIGIVSQDTHLFDATLRENIGYGKDESQLEDIQEAAKAAYAHDFIMQLPLGYDTVIGENGIKLSGGERQRIAIARAILRNPPILILDEATSALDSESERIVQLALANLMKDRTTFVIAHRLSTVQHASKILVLDKGHIVEYGTHEELLKLKGLYSRLHAIQFQNFEDVHQAPQVH